MKEEKQMKKILILLIIFCLTVSAFASYKISKNKEAHISIVKIKKIVPWSVIVKFKKISMTANDDKAYGLFEIPEHPLSEFGLGVEGYKNIDANQKIGFGIECRDNFINNNNEATSIPIYLVYRYAFFTNIKLGHPFIAIKGGYSFLTNRRGSFEKIGATLYGNYYWGFDVGYHFYNNLEITLFMENKLPGSNYYEKIEGPINTGPYEFETNGVGGISLGYEFNL